MLELMKQILNIDVSDNSKDNVLNYYLNRAEKAIIHYLNVSEMPTGYDDVIVALAVMYYNNPSSAKQQSQGSRSVSFTDGIPNSIKMALPKPRIKVMG